MEFQKLQPYQREKEPSPGLVSPWRIPNDIKTNQPTDYTAENSTDAFERHIEGCGPPDPWALQAPGMLLHSANVNKTSLEVTASTKVMQLLLSAPLSVSSWETL